MAPQPEASSVASNRSTFLTRTANARPELPPLPYRRLSPVEWSTTARVLLEYPYYRENSDSQRVPEDLRLHTMGCGWSWMGLSCTDPVAVPPRPLLVGSY